MSNLSFYCRKDPQPVPFRARLLLLQAVAVPAAGARSQEAGGGLPGAAGAGLQARVSFETSFDSKQPKVVSALSETKLFRLFRFYSETESFDVSIEPKQTEDQPKQFQREHIGYFRKFWVVSVCYKTVLFVLVVSIYDRNTETNRNFLFLVSQNKPKHNQNRSCFGLFRFRPKFFLFVSRTPYFRLKFAEMGKVMLIWGILKNVRQEQRNNLDHGVNKYKDTKL